MWIKCKRCGGYGQVLVINDFAPGLSSTLAAKCPACDGMGKFYWSTPMATWDGDEQAVLPSAQEG